MKLRIRTLKKISLTVAGISAALSFVLGLVTGNDWGHVIPATLVTLLVIYVICYAVFRAFVMYRIKPIYQLLFSKNIKTSELPEYVGSAESMQEHINSWAESNADKIARLQETERYRKEFMGDVSHELKTPIFNIQGYITTLLDGGLEDPGINRKYLERAEKSIDRLINIVQDLERISQLETNSLRLERKNFDIVALCRELSGDVEMLAARKRISIRIGSGQSQPPVMVYADRYAVSQVVSNLLSNAVKYGNPGGWVKIGFIDGFDKVLVEVEDNGIGIPEEYQSRVFERFFRVDKSRSREQGGTGLGLAIVKHIIEAQGQTIAVRSRVGEGTTFSFSLEKAG